MLWRAADQLELGPEAAAPAEAAGLIELGALVRFRHPLVRSAVYQAASSHERREAHQALAESIDADIDPDRQGMAPRAGDARVPTRKSPGSSSVRQAGRRLAAASRLRPRSSSAPPR